MRALLRDRSFRRLLVGQTLSAFGDYAMFLALAIWVRDLTGSNAAAGLTFLPFSIPSLFGPALGVFIDRYPRRTIMIWTDAAAAVVVLSLLAVHGREDLWIIYAVAFLLGTCLVIYQAARSGMLVGMLPEDQLGNANGFLQSTEQASRLVAPLAGAALYAASGGATVAILEAATFVVSAAFLLSIHPRDLDRVAGGRFWPELRTGLRHILGTRELRRLTIGTALVTLVVGMTEVAIFALIDEGLHRGPSFLGVISSVQGVGSIAAGLSVGLVLRRIGELRTVATAAFVAAAAMLAFGSARLVPVFVAAIALGAAITLFNVGYVTLLQRRSSLEMQGRVMSAAEAVVTLPYLVSFVIGAAIVSFVPFRTIYLIEAVGLCIAGIYFWRPAEVEPAEPQAAVSIDGSEALSSVRRGCNPHATDGHSLGCTLVAVGVRTAQSAPDAGAGGRHLMDHQRRLEGPHRYARREFLKRAPATGIALPSLSAILAACGGGAQTQVGAGSTASGSSGANPYGTGGIAGAPYPLARQDAPVTWNVDPADVTASGQQPESGATLKVLRWPYYLDDGVVKAFEKQYHTTVQITEFSDMDKGLAKINSGNGDFDIMFGMNVWAVGRSIAAGLLRPYNHDYLTNFTNNVWDLFQSPFYDQGANYTVPYSVWSTGIFWRNDKLSIDPGSMANPYDVFFDNPPKGKTALLANAQDVLAMPMFHDGLTDVNVTDPAVITKAKDDVAAIAQKAGGLSYDHVDYTDLPAGTTWLHQSWSGNASDAVVFLTNKSDADNLSYYWPGTDGHPANVDNDTTVLLKSGKNPVLAHLLADWVFDAKQSLANFTNTTGYQMPVNSMTPESMVSSGIVPEHLSTVIVSTEDFGKGSRELELAPDVDALWQSAFAELTAGV